MPKFWRRGRSQEEDEQELFFTCAELILPWLSPQEIANVSSTCKTLHRFSKSITRSRCSDACRGLENLPVPFINSVDQYPYAYFIYTPSQLLPSSRSLERQPWGSVTDSDFDVRVDSPKSLAPESLDESGELGSFPLSESEAPSNRDSLRLVDESGSVMGGCDCGRCDESDGCPCLGMEGMGMINECGAICQCGLECGNRSTQRGLSVLLKIVRDGWKGWCLCAGQQIPQGQFVCEYAGELLTTTEARKRHQVYDKLASECHISSALLVIREHLPSGKACLRINIDATRVGNIARFINHSCDGGNLYTVLVRSSGDFVPRLCFIASRDIQENEELTFSYGDIRIRSKGLPCFCGSSTCYGTMPSEDT